MDWILTRFKSAYFIIKNIAFGDIYGNIGKHIDDNFSPLAWYIPYKSFIHTSMK